MVSRSAMLIMMIFFTSVGCATFKANHLQPVDKNDLLDQEPEKAKVFQRWTVESDYDNPEIDAALRGLQEKYFTDAAKRSQCCEVVEDPGKADIELTGVAYVESHRVAVFAGTLTGASLFIIPSWATETVHIKANVKHTAISKSYEFRDSVTFVLWLPLIFALPFTDSPQDATKALKERVFDNLILNIKKDNIFALAKENKAPDSDPPLREKKS